MSLEYFMQVIKINKMKYLSVRSQICVYEGIFLWLFCSAYLNTVQVSTNFTEYKPNLTSHYFSIFCMLFFIIYEGNDNLMLCFAMNVMIEESDKHEVDNNEEGDGDNVNDDAAYIISIRVGHAVSIVLTGNGTTLT